MTLQKYSNFAKIKVKTKLAKCSGVIVLVYTWTVLHLIIDAFAPQARERRKTNEGPSYGCTVKGKKEASTQANFMVAISYGCDV